MKPLQGNPMMRKLCVAAGLRNVLKEEDEPETVREGFGRWREWGLWRMEM